MSHRHLLTFAVLVVFGAWTACDDTDGSDPGSGPQVSFGPGLVTDNDLWSVVPLAEDPFAPEDPSTVTPCGPERYGPEIIDNLVWYDVDTIGCDYLTIQQPALRSAEPGAGLLVWMFHFAIVSVTGDFQIVIAAGEQAERILWQRQEAVPAESALWYETVTLEQGLDTGEPIWFHISNHGQNTWSLIELSTVATEANAP